MPDRGRKRGTLKRGDLASVSAIPFPSNSVTLGKLRVAGGHDPELIEALVHNLLLLEAEIVADATWAVREPSHTTAHYTVLVENSRELSKAYLACGAAAGKHHADELVKGLIEWSRAAAQPASKNR